MVRSASDGSPDIDCHIYNAQYFDDDLGRWMMGLAVSMVDARSTGRVSLTSTDPEAPPRIEHRHFSEPGDMERMCDGIEKALEIFRTPELGAVVEPVEDRTWQWSDRDELRTLVRQSSDTTNHCSGTAKMGPESDPLSVTDPTGKVYGSENLYVADSSLFPTCPRGNIHFAVVAVAEKIADGLS